MWDSELPSKDNTKKRGVAILEQYVILNSFGSAAYENSNWGDVEEPYWRPRRH
jgi:hypothetical protein